MTGPTTSAERIEAIARHLARLHETRERLVPLEGALRPLDLDEGYAVQERLQEILGASRGPIVGYKIAITTAVMQDLMGMTHPIGGAVFAKRYHEGTTGSPVILRHADHVNLAVECEIGVRLGYDLPGGAKPYDRESIAQAVEACMASIEIIDDQHADYKPMTALDLLSNNAWNGGVVFGPAVTNWRHLDLAGLGGEMTIGGRSMGKGKGADVMGHPFNAVAWLANHLAKRGRPLKKGMVISTGSIVATKWPKTGEDVVVAIEGLGEAVARWD